MDRNTVRRWHGAAWVVGTLTATGAVAAGIDEVLTPATYFECQIAAREATIVGIRERIAQAQKVGTTTAEKQAATELARGRVDATIYACGRQNGATLGAYAHRNTELLRTWLEANPRVRARLDDAGMRIQALSAQMQPAASIKR